MHNWVRILCAQLSKFCVCKWGAYQHAVSRSPEEDQRNKGSFTRGGSLWYGSILTLAILSCRKLLLCVCVCVKTVISHTVYFRLCRGVVSNDEVTTQRRRFIICCAMTKGRLRHVPAQFELLNKLSSCCVLFSASSFPIRSPCAWRRLRRTGDGKIYIHHPHAKPKQCVRVNSLTCEHRRSASCGSRLWSPAAPVDKGLSSRDSLNMTYSCFDNDLITPHWEVRHDNLSSQIRISPWRMN